MGKFIYAYIFSVRIPDGKTKLEKYRWENGNDISSTKRELNRNMIQSWI
jgi:hypothetical protein